MSSAEPIKCPFCASSVFPNCCVFARHEYELHVAGEKRKQEKARELMPAAEQARIQSIDFIARLADAWDGRGRNVFTAGGGEHLALLNLAGLDASLARVYWNNLDGDERRKLVFAARRAIEFGRQCAWVFGEGQGAR